MNKPVDKPVDHPRDQQIDHRVASPINLLIDCDPGVDDAIALLLAFGSPELNLLGITTVGGNVPLVHTQTNARKICELAQVRDVPVAAGCGRPLVRSGVTTAEYVHGSTGLGQMAFPLPTLPLSALHGVDFLIDRLMTATEPIALATLGPLTNLAVALVKTPEITTKIQSVTVMGGAMTYGNITPSAEFNFYCDPHAAQVVFEAGLPLTMIGLDITHRVITTPDRLARIRAIGDPIGTTVATLLEQYSHHDMAHYGFAGAPLHDPCVVAYLIDPTLFKPLKTRRCFVEIETQSERSLGRSIVDWYGVSGQMPNVEVVCDVDSDRFYALLVDRLARVQRHSVSKL
jgi:purine nucleosidase